MHEQKQIRQKGKIWIARIEIFYSTSAKFDLKPIWHGILAYKIRTV